MTDGLGLEHAYGATIERIKAQDEGKRGLGAAALMWVGHAERPLRADELCHALAIKLGCKDFNADNAPSISTLVGCCQGLITVDKETSTVRLIHPTVKEYLSTRTDIFSNPHSAMAEICLIYLNSEQVKALPADPDTVIHDNPFLEYCSIYWGIHAKWELSDHVRSLALELLQEYDGHISGKLLLKQVKYLDRRGPASNPGSDLGSDIDFPFSGLDCASFFGIGTLVFALTKMELSRNQGGVLVHAPLAWATRNGHDEVVRVILGDYRLNLNHRDYFGLTPLIYAIRCGHERVVEILGRPVTNLPDDNGKTPLSYAAQDGLAGVVKILLWRYGFDPHIPNLHGQTPLWYAASGGHEEVVKMLLGWKDVNPDKPDNDGQTPLMRAASGGHEGVVKILLGREEVNPNKPANNGETPLMIASRLGFQEVMTLLQSHEAKTPARPEA